MVKDILNFIRWKNLLMAAIVLALGRFFIIRDFYLDFEINAIISLSDYLMFSFAVLLLVVAASCLDEWLNKRFYLQNRPDQIYIGTTISEKRCLPLSLSCSIVAIAISYGAGANNGVLHLGTLTLFCTALIWLYAYSNKRQPLAGKFIAALLCALILFVPVLFEVFALNALPDMLIVVGIERVETMIRFTAIFSGLIFLVVFLRELVKDLRDADDDMEVGCKTFVTEFTDKATKTTAYVFSLAIMVLAVYFQYTYYAASPLMILGGVTALIHLPLLYFVNELRKAQAVQDYDFLVKLLQMVLISCFFAMNTAKYIL